MPEIPHDADNSIRDGLMELVVKFHGRPSIATMGESTGWVCRDVGSGSHLMRATLWQVLNVSNVHTHCATATGCSVGVEVCGQTTVAAADKGT